METNKTTTQKVDEVLSSLDNLEEVKISPFFKQSVLNKIELEKEKSVIQFSWFSPQLQLAAVCIVLLLNAIVMFYTFTNNSSVSENSIETFAQEYHLQSSSDSILN